MQRTTAKLIEHHSVLVVDPQSAQTEFDGSAFRIVVNVVCTDLLLVLEVLSFPPVNNSLVS
jgi:hypothetical protein